MEQLVSALFHLPRVVDDTRFCRLVDALSALVTSRHDAAHLFALLDAACPPSAPLLTCDVRIAAATLRLAGTALCALRHDAAPSDREWPRSRAVLEAIASVSSADEAVLVAHEPLLVDATLQFFANVAVLPPAAIDACGGWRCVLAFAVNCFHVESLFVERSVCRVLAHLASLYEFPEPIMHLVISDEHVCLQVLLEALQIAPELDGDRRKALLALISNRLLPNALLSVRNADRLVQAAVLDCVTAAASQVPSLVDVGALCARVVQFVASDGAESTTLAFRVAAALHVHAGDGAAVDRVLVLFDDVLATAADWLARFLRHDPSAAAWRVPLTAALKTAEALLTRYGCGDSDLLWSLIPACIEFRSDAVGDASGSIALSAVNLLLALGRCPGRWQAPLAEASLVAALRVTAIGTARQAMLATALDAALDALAQRPSFAAPGSAVLVHFVAALHALFASELWERRDTAVAAVVRLAALSRSAAAPLLDHVVRAVTDEQPYVRAAALSGLAASFADAVPSREAVQSGVAAIGDTEAVVRRAACEWIGALLAHADADTRAAAVVRLGEVREAFDRLMFDADWEVKRQLVSVLLTALRVHGATFLQADCVARLKTLLEDSARLVRLDAATALLKVRHMLAVGEDAALDLEGLVTANSECEAWNTDFDGIEVSEQRQQHHKVDFTGYHSHHHGEAASDEGDDEIDGNDDDDDSDDEGENDDVPLDCE